MLPFKYPWRRPYGAWLFTTGALLVILLPGTVWAERHLSLVLPGWGFEAILVLSNFVGLGAAIWVFHRQNPPEPGDLDDPNW